MIPVQEETAGILTGSHSAISEVIRQLGQAGHGKDDPRTMRLLEEALAKVEGAMDRVYRSNPSLAQKHLDTLNTHILIVDAGAVGKLEAVDLALLAYDEAGHPKGGARRDTFMQRLARLFGVEKKGATA